MNSCSVFAAVSVGEDVSTYIPAAPILLPEGPWHQVSNWCQIFYFYFSQVYLMLFQSVYKCLRVCTVRGYVSMHMSFYYVLMYARVCSAAFLVCIMFGIDQVDAVLAAYSGQNKLELED